MVPPFCTFSLHLAALRTWPSSPPPLCSSTSSSMTAATSTPFTALGGLVLVGVMFRMVLVLVENEVVVVMVALVVTMVLAGFIKPSYRAGQAEGCHLYRV